MNSIQKAFMSNCCERCGRTLDFSKDKYCPYCGHPNFNYHPATGVSHSSSKTTKRKKEDNTSTCCILIAVFFIIAYIYSFFVSG